MERIVVNGLYRYLAYYVTQTLPSVQLGFGRLMVVLRSRAPLPTTHRPTAAFWPHRKLPAGEHGICPPPLRAPSLCISSGGVCSMCLGSPKHLARCDKWLSFHMCLSSSPHVSLRTQSPRLNHVALFHLDVSPSGVRSCVRRIHLSVRRGSVRLQISGDAAVRRLTVSVHSVWHNSDAMLESFPVQLSEPK